jgi:hypothetical protein
VAECNAITFKTKKKWFLTLNFKNISRRYVSQAKYIFKKWKYNKDASEKNLKLFLGSLL